LGKKEGTYVATLAQDSAFGKDFVKAFKDAFAGSKGKLVFEEYAPMATNDFTASAQRLFDALKDRCDSAKDKTCRKIIFINWAGAGNPFKIADLDPKRYGIEIATGGNILPAMVAYRNFPGMEGAAYYYFGIPKNRVNEWLVAEHYKKFKTPPDFFTAGGMSAGIAVVEALKKTGGNTATEKLISAMEGMSFETPKGKMTFRKEDHQAMQSMYHFRIKKAQANEWDLLEMVREFPASQLPVPIRNKR
jgi:branched-chain amino acid transport system substrate-binding protein